MGDMPIVPGHGARARRNVTCWTDHERPRRMRQTRGIMPAHLPWRRGALMATGERETAGSGRRWPRWVLAAALVLAVAGFYALGLQHTLDWDYVRSHVGVLQAWVQQ